MAHFAGCFLALAASAEFDVSGESSCQLSSMQIDANQICGPQDECFHKAKMNQYAQFWGTQEMAKDKLNPGMVVLCSEEAHVQSAVRFASRCGYKVAIRGGGHSYTASSSCNESKCLQLDTTAMNQITSQGLTLKLGPGAKIIDVANYYMTQNMSIPHGVCSGVGVGGHYQSSAWGFMSHSHGSGLDRVESFRMVLADGSIGEYSRHDQNDTVYKSVLGSAPGSWGVITEFTLNAVADSEVPHTRVLYTRILYSRQNFVKAWNHAQFVVMDQERRNLRDYKILVVVGPPSDEDWVDASDSYIIIASLWTGIDSGNMTQEWIDLYWEPFLKLDHLPFPATFNSPLPLSVSTTYPVVDWKNSNDRYAVQAMHSDLWWSEEFTEIMADEMDERMALMPDIYPSWQFAPLGRNSQWARNAGMNALTWRDTRSYIDDWMFTKNESRYDEMVERMVSFREKTRHFWQFSDGSDRSTWMSPKTTYPGGTDLRNSSVAKQYFPHDGQFEALQRLKAELDPKDVFSNTGTIPLRENMYQDAVRENMYQDAVRENMHQDAVRENMYQDAVEDETSGSLKSLGMKLLLAILFGNGVLIQASSFKM